MRKLFVSGAFDPRLFADDRFLHLMIAGVIGGKKGRYIETIPAQWVADSRDVIKGITDHTRRIKAEEVLKRIVATSSVVNTKFTQKIYEDWLRQLSHFLRTYTLDFAIVTDESPLAPPLYSIALIDDLVNYFDEQSGFFEITPETDKKELQTQFIYFFNANRRVCLINRTQWLFHGPKTDVELATTFIRNWADLGGLSFRFIRSRNSEDYSDSRLLDEISKLESLLHSLKAHGEFGYFVVDDSKVHKLHERYMLGSFVGVEMGYGLQLRSTEKYGASRERPQSWKVIPEAARKSLWQTYAEREPLELYGRPNVLKHLVPSKN